ncbi:MAG: hypothetical protein CM15mP74_27930 [Halieaceae bacterium]|nr:MAG: hypothetical protein CM15mP74_27930 [Halieaceae bacterium]
MVGAGISGLAAAYFYRQKKSIPTQRYYCWKIDDFGGHAKRNEFHQGGEMVLSLGGTHNLEWWKFSDVVTGLLSGLGVDPHAMREDMTFDYGHDAPTAPRCGSTPTPTDKAGSCLTSASESANEGAN